MFKFHYVQMKQFNLVLSQTPQVAFKFHYVQMKQKFIVYKRGAGIRV